MCMRSAQARCSGKAKLYTQLQNVGSYAKEIHDGSPQSLPEGKKLHRV